MNIESKVFDWMNEFGRPLELAQYKLLFRHGSNDDFLDELFKFQNEDGGFGHGLEPDTLNPHSSPIQTWMAAEYLDDAEIQLDDPRLSKMINYLENAMDENGMFPTTIPSNNEYPHAIWWHYQEEKSYWGYNPSVALWGFIYKVIKSEKAKTYLTLAFNHFIDFGSEEMHELRCFIDAYEWVYAHKKSFGNFNLFEIRLKDEITKMLKNFSMKSLESYGPSPISFCSCPKSLLYPMLRSKIMMQTEALKEQIKNNPIWDINFNWGQYDDDFEHARRVWQGVLAVGYMKFMIK